MKISERQRFWNKVNVTPTGCWPWTGKPIRGYGYFMKESGQRIPAHRYSYILHGHTVGEEDHVHHKCKNPMCVNPSHLEAVHRNDHQRKFHPRMKKPKKGRKCKHKEYIKGCLFCHLSKIGSSKSLRKQASSSVNAAMARRKKIEMHRIENS